MAALQLNHRRPSLHDESRNHGQQSRGDESLRVGVGAAAAATRRRHKVTSRRLQGCTGALGPPGSTGVKGEARGARANQSATDPLSWRTLREHLATAELGKPDAFRRDPSTSWSSASGARCSRWATSAQIPARSPWVSGRACTGQREGHQPVQPMDGPESQKRHSCTTRDRPAGQRAGSNSVGRESVRSRCPHQTPGNKGCDCLLHGTSRLDDLLANAWHRAGTSLHEARRASRQSRPSYGGRQHLRAPL